jgi:hypothetical protein
VAVVIDIPATTGDPHQASDRRYYRRHNFNRLRMEHYEVRDAFPRTAAPRQASSMKALGGVFDAANLSRRIGLHQLRGCLDRPTKHMAERYFLRLLAAPGRSFLRSRSRLTFCVDAEGLGYPDSSAVAPHIKPRLPVPVGFPAMALASAAVHSNKRVFSRSSG